MTLSRIPLLLAFIALCAGTLPAQKPPLSNQDVIDMVKAGLSEKTVTRVIRSSQTQFDTSSETLIYLRNLGISDAILSAMLVGGKHKAGPANPHAWPTDVGIYWIKDGKPVEMGADVVEYKTGGVAKKVLTDGLDKGHTNGVVNGPHSKVRSALPAEFVIVTFEGVTPSEYILVKLDEKSDRREFRRETNGVVHKSSGPARNAVDFNSEKLAPHTYRVRLANLAPGEYGFLPPIGARNHSASASGRIYAFSVLN